MKKALLLLPVLAGLIWTCTTPKQVERPMDTWVFRSVLDERPRMLTAALHDNLWVAYDVQTATMYKAWKGGVDFDGAVYTTRHGPQPSSLGYAYYTNENNHGWTLLKDGKEVPAKVKYLGHQFMDGGVKLNFELITPEGEYIQISESPEYHPEGTRAGIIRRFTLSNETDYKVGLHLSASSLQNENDYKTDGQFTTEDTQKRDYSQGSLIDVDGLLILNEASTYLSNTFHPGFEQIAMEAAEKSAMPAEGEETEQVAGAALIEQSDCKACHNEEVKTVGPAYLSVARKYDDSEATINMLVSRVQKGNSGVWGEAMMTPHPDLMEADAVEMIKYILSLDDNEKKEFDKVSLGEKAVPLSLEDKYTGGAGKGLMANVYYDVATDDMLELEEKSKPVKQGPVAKLHLLSETDFGKRPEHFGIIFKGSINIVKESSYDFRLISDDGSCLFIDDKLVIDHGGLHGMDIKDGEFYLTAGKHQLEVRFHQAGGGAGLSWQWFNREKEQFEIVPGNLLSFDQDDIDQTVPYIPPAAIGGELIPGDASPLVDVHPSFDLYQARPDDFEPKVGGIDFLQDGRMLVCTWEPEGPVYLIENWQSGKPTQMKVKKIASGLAEPLGLKVVNNEIYVLQKQELTKLIDHDGDEIIDEYRAHAYDWRVSANFHEFAFGLVYKDGYFYGTLATAILPGGASAQPQIPDRGKVVKIGEKDGSVELIAHGLRTPNGIGIGVDEEIFIADNQGDWLPASKINHLVEGVFFGSRSVDPEGTKDMDWKRPVVWLPQDEIGNSPSTPIYIDKGPYDSQMIHCEVTNGGIKRVFVEKVNGQYQGALFRFSQGLEAGVNRIIWAPDGSLIVGGVGSSGNWGHTGKKKFGLQRLVFNEKTTFEMQRLSARNNGFEITFTEALAEDQQISADDIRVEQWYYLPTVEYGGPKMDQKELKIARFELSPDRKKIRLELPGIKADHVVYFRLNNKLQSASGQKLWSTEAWYTLNEIPGEKLATLK